MVQSVRLRGGYPMRMLIDARGGPFKIALITINAQSAVLGATTLLGLD